MLTQTHYIRQAEHDGISQVMAGHCASLASTTVDTYADGLDRARSGQTYGVSTDQLLESVIGMLNDLIFGAANAKNAVV